MRRSTSRGEKGSARVASPTVGGNAAGRGADSTASWGEQDNSESDNETYNSE